MNHALSFVRSHKLATLAFLLIMILMIMQFRMGQSDTSATSHHRTQSEAAWLCQSGIAESEEVRHESGGDYHYYPCYGGGEVAAYE